MDMTCLRTGAVALTAVCLLSACASSGTTTPSRPPSPTPPPTSTTAPPSPTTTATPTKSGSVAPDLATSTAAAKAYFGAYNQAKLTRDTTAFRRTFKVTFKICAADAADLDRYTRLGQTLYGGDYRMAGATSVKGSLGGTVIHFSVTQDASSLTDQTGKTVRTFEGGRAPDTYFQFGLVSGTWIVIGSIVSS